MSREWTEIVVEDDLDTFDVYSDGSVRPSIAMYLTQEQYQRMWDGFMCVRCFEPQTTAFPETCGFRGCDGYPDGFPMRERQRQVMESEMENEVRKTPASGKIWTPPKGLD